MKKISQAEKSYSFKREQEYEQSSQNDKIRKRDKKAINKDIEE